MKFDWKRFLFSLLAIAVILIVLHFVLEFLTYQTQQFSSASIFLAWGWMYFWPLPLAAYFARDHIKTWFKSGKLKIEIGSLIITALCLAVIIPEVNYPPFYFLLNTRFLPFVAIFSWYHLLYAFTRDSSSQPAIRENTKGKQFPVSPFDVDIR